jgi:hypothetical protein
MFFGEPGSYHHSRLAVPPGVVMMVRQQQGPGMHTLIPGPFLYLVICVIREERPLKGV